ncbi:MAG TPA: endolytic transglycosylase MltG, partial [Candidatus Andersenbacteria bacterium]|nr:endolytic transglycosylase MltG [Candidatus Andersenbacteria bacterium]
MIRIERPVRFIIFLLALTGLVVGVILGSIRLIMGPSTIQKSGSVTIEEGAAAGAIWEQMVEQDFTPRTLPWRYHAWRQEAAGRIKAGTYEVTVNETVADVVRRLASGTTNSAELTVTYPEGFTIQQIAARTAARGLSNEDDFIHAATPSLYVEEFPFLRDIPPGRDLEGYLFPDTYRFLTDDTPRDIIRRMLATFERRVVVPGLAAPAVPTGRTLDQILIMASIIEREVISDEDMAQVAGVLWRRLDNGVGLGADATIR